MFHPTSKQSRLVLTLLFLSAATLFCVPTANADENEKYIGNYLASLECPGGAIEFELQVLRSLEDGNKLRGKIVNGLEESINIPNVTVDEEGLLIDIDHFDSRIRATKATSGELIGTWEKRRGNDKWSRLEFDAVELSESGKKDLDGDPDAGVTFHGESNEPDPIHAKFSGRWLVKFEKSKDPAIAIFSTGKEDLAIDARETPFFSSRNFSGTFLTPTGDYRFLAGNVSDEGKKATLSCFDGGHAFLFKMELQTDGSIKGDFWSSDSWHEKWTAMRGEDAKLPDAFAQTKLLESNINELEFSDLDGKTISIGDKAFSGKARLVYVFGSWCPNCHDAAAYFSYLQKTRFRDRDLSILGLAFELTDDQERNAMQIKKYLARHGCEYPVLIAGPADKELATKAFPVLDRVRSYPTTLFLDEDGNIKAVHTGFTGPATGEAFEELKKKFETQIESLLKE